MSMAKKQVPAPHNQRSNVIKVALLHGWQHDYETFDDGNIIRDLFTSDLGQVRAVWLRTPWSDAGRWTGSIFSEKATHTERNVWKVTTDNGLLALLASISPPAADVLS
jgi:hypothetical protein